MENIAIYNENCLTGMARIETGMVDLVLCDLPYGTTNCAWDTVIPFAPLWAQYSRVLKPNGALLFMAAQPFATALINSNRRLFRYDLVWEKSAPTGHANCKRMPMRSHELILVFYKHLPTYHPQGLIKLDKPRRKAGAHRSGGVYNGMDKDTVQEFTHYPRSVLHYPFHGKRVHPTQKPLELFTYLVETYTDAGDLVLDNCMGSGTTGVACVNTGRRFVGFETDAGYFEIARARMEAAKGSTDTSVPPTVLS